MRNTTEAHRRNASVALDLDLDRKSTIISKLDRLAPNAKVDIPRRHSVVMTEDLGCMCTTAPYKAVYRGLVSCFKRPEAQPQNGTSSASMGVSAHRDFAVPAASAAPAAP